MPLVNCLGRPNNSRRIGVPSLKIAPIARKSKNKSVANSIIRLHAHMNSVYISISICIQIEQIKWAWRRGAISTKQIESFTFYVKCQKSPQFIFITNDLAQNSFTLSFALSLSPFLPIATSNQIELEIMMRSQLDNLYFKFVFSFQQHTQTHYMKGHTAVTKIECRRNCWAEELKQMFAFFLLHTHLSSFFLLLLLLLSSDEATEIALSEFKCLTHSFTLTHMHTYTCVPSSSSSSAQPAHNYHFDKSMKCITVHISLLLNCTQKEIVTKIIRNEMKVDMLTEGFLCDREKWKYFLCYKTVEIT